MNVLSKRAQNCNNACFVSRTLRFLIEFCGQLNIQLFCHRNLDPGGHTYPVALSVLIALYNFFKIESSLFHYYDPKSVVFYITFTYWPTDFSHFVFPGLWAIFALSTFHCPIVTAVTTLQLRNLFLFELSTLTYLHIVNSGPTDGEMLNWKQIKPAKHLRQRMLKPLQTTVNRSMPTIGRLCHSRDEGLGNSVQSPNAMMMVMTGRCCSCCCSVIFRAIAWLYRGMVMDVYPLNIHL